MVWKFSDSGEEAWKDLQTVHKAHTLNTHAEGFIQASIETELLVRLLLDCTGVISNFKDSNLHSNL